MALLLPQSYAALDESLSLSQRLALLHGRLQDMVQFRTYRHLKPQDRELRLPMDLSKPLMSSRH